MDHKVLYVRIPRKLHDQLMREAEKRDLSLTRFVAQLLAESVPRLIPANELTVTR